MNFQPKEFYSGNDYFCLFKSVSTDLTSSYFHSWKFYNFLRPTRNVKKNFEYLCKRKIKIFMYWAQNLSGSEYYLFILKKYLFLCLSSLSIRRDLIILRENKFREFYQRVISRIGWFWCTYCWSNKKSGICIALHIILIQFQNQIYKLEFNVHIDNKHYIYEYHLNLMPHEVMTIKKQSCSNSFDTEKTIFSSSLLS